ncbi:NAD(P)/FAD-dependent oxidoreductase [Metallosphaera tengchongensis]|uniref:NAD(P)/FAD-dependent oxidoreductase n=1 Tax=Metallosphaera tengchongensis TaxID=1532350 RepID=A0A6N0NUW6_9CREN|nr:NAD(P)/FAD-dependent oxidoreductase [Metallosphaera tengchongensis]QKQ99642.1 NAD(P)/FAD-dependent oxidoreductase [Metallosphaera tengchongensis]
MKVVVVGSGPSGLYAALTASQRGSKVTLVEKSDKLGGTCVLFGCIPSKAMMAPLGASYFLSKYDKKVDISFHELQEGMRTVVNRVSKGVEYMLESSGVEVVHGEARLNGGKVEVNGQTLEQDTAVIAPGMEKPEVPGTISSDDLHYITKDFTSVLLVGGGVGGVEYGWLLHMAGKKVTIVERENLLLPGHDKDLRSGVTSMLKRMGLEVLTNSNVQIDSNDLKINGERVDYDLVVYTFGRKVRAKGFETLMKGKWLEVDQYMRTGLPNVYASGDATGSFTAHEAIHKGIAAGANASGDRRMYNGTAVPKVLYTHPEIAYVGNTEGTCVKLSMAEVVRAVAEKATEGFVKICKNDEGYINGGVALSERAEDMITVVSLLMRLNVRLSQAKDLMFPHPSYLEGIWEALRRLEP